MALKGIICLAAAILVTLLGDMAVARSAATLAHDAMPRSGLAKVQGEDFWFNDSGSRGAPVILLHPGTGTSDYWAGEMARPRAAGFRVIVYDRRNWGSTTAVPMQAEGGPGAAQDLEDFLDYLKLSRFHLIAIASGGRVALDYASEHSRRLLSLIVIGLVGPAFCNEGESELNAYHSRIAIPRFSPAARKLSSTCRGDDPDGVKRWQAIQDGAKKPNAVDVMGGPQTYGQIGKVSAPTLVMTGCANVLVPPGDAILCATHIPKSWWIVPPSAADFLPWDQPRAFTDIVMRFMHGDRTFKRSADCVGKEDLAGACRISRG